MEWLGAPLAGTPCEGYTAGMLEGAPRQGKVKCGICDRSADAPRFRGKTGDTCVGYEVYDGNKLTGVLKCPP